MDRLLRALDANFHNFTLWNYTSDNSNERGDGWNGEDLSIFSRDQQTDPRDLNSGGRALEALVRPWPRRIAGQPLALRFNIKTREFTFSFKPDPDATAPTEIFVPAYQYPQGYVILVSAGRFSVDPGRQLVLWHGDAESKKYLIRITLARAKCIAPAGRGRCVLCLVNLWCRSIALLPSLRQRIICVNLNRREKQMTYYGKQMPMHTQYPEAAENLSKKQHPCPHKPGHFEDIHSAGATINPGNLIEVASLSGIC